MTQQEQHWESTPVTWTLPAKPPTSQGAKVGVLALQGDFLEHLQVLRHLGAEALEVRQPKDLEGLQALVIPGGESTTMARMMDLHGLREPLRQLILKGLLTWGTCAGLILLARRLREDRPLPLGLMDVEVARNAFGRQVDSFEVDIPVPVLGPPPFHAVFIRAPAILSCGPGVQVLARLADETPVAARQGHLLVTAFHPELTLDLRFHAYFLGLLHLRSGSGETGSSRRNRG